MKAIETLLETSRNKLLDLTLRNSLLNYRLNKIRRVAIVDELPDELYRRLINGTAMKMLPVPFSENALLAQAQSLQIRTDEEAPTITEMTPEDKHTDSAIQTLHYPEELERLMRSLRSDANAAILETGSNLLFLAIGFLQWKPSPGSDKLLHAPLILLPVHIERGAPDRKTGAYAYKLIYSGEDLFSNISLLYKIRQDFAITLPEFDENDTPERYFQAINEICSHRSELIGVSRRFALDFFHFSKLLMYLDLNPAHWPQENNITDNRILQEIAGDAAEPFYRPFEPLDEEETERIPLLLDADSSQREAIAQVLRGHNLIIEGPPGTGKSQTIANLIAALLSEGKSVLFIAEKLVALEVVKKRLDVAGMGDFVLELHSHKSNKANFYASLAERVNLETSQTSDDLSPALQRLDTVKTHLNDYLKQLHTPIAIVERTPYDVLGETLERARAEFDALPSDAAYLAIDKSRYDALEHTLKSLGNLIREMPDIMHSPWNGLTVNEAIALDAPFIADLFFKQKELFDALAEIIDHSQLPITKKLHQLQTLQNVIASGTLRDCPAILDLKVLERFDSDQLLLLIEHAEKLIETASAFKAVDPDAFIRTEDLRTLSRTLRGFKPYGWFRRLASCDYKEATRQFYRICTQQERSNVSEMCQALDACIEKIESFEHSLEAFNAKGGSELFESLKLPPSDLSDPRKAMQSIESLQRITTLKHPLAWKRQLLETGFEFQTYQRLLQENRREYIAALETLATQSEGIVSELERLDHSIERYGTIDHAGFYGDDTHLEILSHVLQEKLEQSSSLSQWISVSQLLIKIQEVGLESAVQFAVQQALETQIDALVVYGYYREWSHKIVRESPLLAEFNRHVHETYLDDFRSLDADIAHLHAGAHAYALSQNDIPPGKNGRVREKTEMYLIRNEIGKQKRHQPIRQSLKRAHKAIRALKPCFMMSPLSVAQFVDPLQAPFDVMIMDEASQIFPEDALGAIARAKQIVVVGDPHQMPPTNFFQGSMSDDREEDEETLASDSESILDMLLRIFPKVKRLTWHYRSRHESLIAFSNHHFYDGELKLFPSPTPQTPDMGIERVFIEEGYFDNQQNSKEAMIMVDAVATHFSNSPETSLGVVAMNKKQSELIERRLEQKTKEDAELRHLIDSASKRGHFFIKNLENVQGDEADTLFIGTTYGVDPQTNKVHQRFGPINGDHGYRRMNVLITRARQKIVLFTSMRSSDVVASEENRGRMALRNYLKYAETGELSRVQSLSTNMQQSSFETTVVRFIETLGYGVKRRVGISGLFVDIAVIHDNRYLLGIECDNFEYHATRSPRDKDRIRYNVLQSMGWNLHRIWSIEWFLHQETEKNRLKEKLEALART